MMAEGEARSASPSNPQKIEVKNGKRLVTFDLVDKVMPTIHEKLQKAVLVPPQGTESVPHRFRDWLIYCLWQSLLTSG